MIIYNREANGGTELLSRRLEAALDPTLLDKVVIYSSRVPTNLDSTKIRILWCHDVAGDPMYEHLYNDGHTKFHKIVFVSHHQMQAFQLYYKIPYSKCMVIDNAIVPVDITPEEHAKRFKANYPIRMIYTSTPHRGLNLLIPAFKELRKDFNITLDVFSSFALYNQAGRDEEFNELFKACQESEDIFYHGSQPNEVVRDFLKQSHIFAYPSTWQETSCLCLIEAMSAGLVCVHSTLGALPETSGKVTIMYPYTENQQDHVNVFYQVLKNSVLEVLNNQDKVIAAGQFQKILADAKFNLDNHVNLWSSLLKFLIETTLTTEIASSRFSYKT